MPSSETEKTKSGRKRFIGWALPAGALVLVFALALWQSRSQQMTVQLGSRTITLVRAGSSAQKEKGLSGTTSLAAGQGMLFWNDHTGEQCMWMKGMHYALDMIWLDANKKVVHIEQDVLPESYPKTFCAEGRYVIEVNAGEVERSGLTKGQRVTF